MLSLTSPFFLLRALATLKAHLARPDCNNSGSLAIFAAIRRASSVLPNWSRNFTAKLFDESVGHRRVRKTPAIIRLALLQNYMAVSRLDVSRIVKLHDPAV